MIDDLLKVVIPREYSGSDVYSRYQYQIFFAAKLIIDMMEKKISFTTLLDHLDDVVIISGSEEDRVITFYQVKTKKDGPLTINLIINNKWLSKMHYNLDNFKDVNSRGIFVTNFGVKINSKVYDNLEIESLNSIINKDEYKEYKDRIIKQISEEYKLEESKINLSDFYILKSDINLDGYEDQIKGKLVDYCSSVNDKLSITALNTIYSQLILELQKRQRKVYSTENIDIDSLKSSKSVSNNDVDDIIEKTWMAELPEFNKLNDFREKVLGYNFTYGDSFEALKMYNKFSVNKIKVGNDLVRYTNELIKDYFDNRLDKNDGEIVIQLIEHLDKDDLLKNSEFFNEYKEFIVLIYLFKLN